MQNLGIPSPGSVNDKIIDFFSHFYSGNGNPEGVLTAAVGGWYLDEQNGIIYTKQTGAGNTGWVEGGAQSGASGWRHLLTSVLSAPAASLTLTPDNPNNCVAFRLTCLGVSSTNTTGQACNLWGQLNGDVAAANAHYHSIITGGDSTNASVYTARNRAADVADQFDLGTIPTDQTTPDVTGQAVYVFDNHPSAHFRTVMGNTGLMRANYTTGRAVQGENVAGVWKQTARLTSIKLAPSVNNFDTGAIFVLEGLVVPLA